MAKTWKKTVTANTVDFVTDKGDKDTFEILAPMAQGEIVGTLSKEIAGRGDVTRACLTMIVELLDHAKCGTWKGQTVTGEKVPKELKGAVTEREVDCFSPLFDAYYGARNKRPNTLDAGKLMEYDMRRSGAWSTFIGKQREGGLYANCKSYSLQYFAYFGKLPCIYEDDIPQKDKLLPVSCMAKEIAIAKAAMVKPDESKLAGLLQEVAELLKASTIVESEARACNPMAQSIALTMANLVKFYDDATAEKVTSTEPAKRAPAPVKAKATKAPKEDKVITPDLQAMANAALAKAGAPALM